MTITIGQIDENFGFKEKCQVPEAAVTFLLENISQALQHYYHLIGDARGNVAELQQQLEELKSVMNDFSRYNHDSEIVEGVVKDIKAVIFEAEDAVDTFLLYAGAQKARSWLERAYHQITDYPKKLLEVGEKMRRVSEKIKVINQDGVNRGIQLLQHQAAIKLIQDDDKTAFKEAPKVEEQHVIGFDGAAETVQKLLTEGPEQLEMSMIRTLENADPYKLDFLTLENSPELLNRKIFQGNECPKHLQDYETRIAEKCAGLLLALVAIAGIIVNDPESNDLWSNVVHSVKDYISREIEETSKVIELMFKHWPNKLKLCFLCLGLFREDFEIPTWKLIRLLIAEGLIKQERYLNMEYVAFKGVHWKANSFSLRTSRYSSLPNVDISFQSRKVLSSVSFVNFWGKLLSGGSLYNWAFTSSFSNFRFPRNSNLLR
ncbi:OLC1v1016015C1 [Oldenlandia corymbosa var. corymbosa]|uniref:OLC1v1016015C1 n=1 Tax=Oldenlandia corymbosa var. corymbosa TaxID=529605 RepID=A0AAV1E6L3_OLDCO|nr:OLC1v1016015C1 [Oldenlandia corymbosa var. corymbosa]